VEKKRCELNTQRDISKSSAEGTVRRESSKRCKGTGTDEGRGKERILAALSNNVVV
jgi:hypothetical protein